MFRPVPQSTLLTELARRVQKTQRRAIKTPTLLSTWAGGQLAIVAGNEDRNLHVFDVAKGKMSLELPLPENALAGSDFRALLFSEEFQAVAAYNKSTNFFTVWSLEDGRILNHVQGSGVIPPALVFVPGRRIAFADSRRIATYRLGGDQESVSYVSEDLRSLVLHAPKEDPSLLVAVGVFRKAELGHLISAFHMRGGRVVAGREGPSRTKPSDPSAKRRVSLHECLTLPGRKGEVLVVLEEERIRHLDPELRTVEKEEYISRLVPIEPTSCQFLDEGKKLKGRYCLEHLDGELHLIDEIGRRRRVTGFPIKCTSVDWRLEA